MPGKSCRVTEDEIVKSTDGVNWDVIKSIPLISGNDVKNKVVFGSGKFLVCNHNYYYFSSDGGQTWVEDDSASVFRGAAYGDGAFYLSSTSGGTLKIDAETLSSTSIAGAMGEITYLDGVLYGVKATASDRNVYYLNNSNVWTALSGSNSIPAGSSRCLKGINNRLFLGIADQTYEIQKDSTNHLCNVSLLDIDGQMIDACTLNGRFYLLTENGLYEDGYLRETPSEGTFTCCCAGKENQVRIVTANGTKAVYTGYTSIAPTFTIKSMAFGNGVYIAVAQDRILRSADGVNWETVQMTSDYYTLRSLYRAIFAEGKFVVSGDCVFYASMDNGSSWSAFSSSVPMDSVAYGDGKFMLASSQYPCVIRLTDALQETWIDTELQIRNIVYINDAFYGIYYKSATENGLYKLNSSNVWTLVLGNLSIGAENCLRAAGGRLFLGSNGITYEFKKAGSEFNSIEEITAISTQMIDACEFPDIETLESRVCIVSDTMMYTTLGTQTMAPYLYANSEYVCCCSDDYGKVLLSQGYTIKKYTQDAAPCNYHIHSICYGNGAYIAAAGDYILRSENSTTDWEVVQTTPTVDGNQLIRAVSGNGVFVVCGGHYYYISTDNGLTWTMGEGAGFITGAAFGNGRFILVDGGTMSIDATTLETTRQYAGNGLRDVAFVNGKFYSIDNDLVFCSLSSDNLWTKWFPVYEAANGYCLRGCGDRLFMGAEGQTYEFQKNSDNTAFLSIEPVLGVYGQLVDGCQMDGVPYLLTEMALHQSNKAVFAPIDSNCTCCCTANDNVNIVVFSYDALGTSRSVYHKGNTLRDYGIEHILSKNDVYIAAAGPRILKSMDGLKWKVVQYTTNNSLMHNLIYGNGTFFVYGNGNYYRSTDQGETWVCSEDGRGITGAAYGAGTFMLIDSNYTILIDEETFDETLINAPGMYDAAYTRGSFYGVRINKESNESTYYLYRFNGNTWVRGCEYAAQEAVPCRLRAAGDRLFYGQDNGVSEFVSNTGSSGFDWLYPYSDVYGTFIDACALEEQDEEVQTFARVLSSAADTDAYAATSTGLYYLGNETVLLESLEDFDVSGLSADKDGLNLTLGSGRGSYQADYCSSNLPDFDSGSDPDFTKDTAKYSVITDTHRTPWGDRGAHFDLGDNTRSYVDGNDGSFKYRDKIEDTKTKTGMQLLGNHDVAQRLHEGLSARQGWKYYEDSRYNVIFYGLDCCNSFKSYEIKIEDIKDIANDLLTEHAGWSVVIMTHLPLFDSGTETAPAWTESYPPNADEVIKLLNAYQAGEIYVPAGSSGSYNFANKSGYVIGCFCGHVHRGMQLGRKATLSNGKGNYGIYMESFTANGEQTFVKVDTYGDGNASQYIPEKQYIEINFKNRTVNGFNYDPKKTVKTATDLYEDKDKHLKGSLPTKKPSLNRVSGFIPLRIGSTNYPLFYMNETSDKNGIYLGYKSVPTKEADWDDIKPFCEPSEKGERTWPLDCTQITVNGSPVSAKSIMFSSDGRLSYRITQDGTEYSIDNDSVITFVSNNVRWNFKDGRYQWDKAKGYGFRKPESSGNSYPIFDTDGRYIGWSDKPNGYMVGGRDAKVSSSLTWSLGKGKATLTIGGVLQGQAESVTFNPNGTLKQFKLTTGTTVTNVTGSVEFVTDGNVTWTFSGGLFYDVKGPNATPIPMDLYDWMDFTSHAYYFNFEDGYLTFYATSKNGTQLYDIAGPWKCGKNVAYYSSASAMAQGQAADATVNTAELTFAKDSAGNRFYISNLDTSYKFAMIQTNYGKYYFQNENGKWLMIHF